MPTEPCAVIWDVDGTLVDTAELHFQAWERMAREMGRPFSRADFAATFGRRNPEIIRFLFHQDFTDAEVADIGERKASRVCKDTHCPVVLRCSRRRRS